MMLRVFVPRDAAAVAVGADEVAAALGAAAKKAGAKVQIVRNGSRGMLWLEPLVEIERDGTRYGFGPVSVSDVESLVKAGLLEGRPVGKIEHPLAIGVVDDHPYLKRQTRLTFARCGITDPVSLDDYLAHDGYKGLERALTLKPIEIVDEVAKSGLRGRGGAGFPTGIKWKTVHDTPMGQQKYIVCNADEGESGTFADRMIMEGDPFLLVEGMTIAGIAVGATRGYI
jgi:formate dehydrogenase iron-sulfur subunit